ncbi:hypothetical protein PGT21_016963 [Puccinia graminis f. sp. tritici]|uniref:Secreted protein n=1 Tax=Puccinia graminis f. sp. tritici TaxID=56615 RepID=A0A5B0M468_PUCGR|nr:hypothetical protein PGT21_016963 [Puccinia graminis f. sp. tritici]
MQRQSIQARSLFFFCVCVCTVCGVGNSWSSNVSTTKDGWVRKPSAFGAGKKPKKDAGGHGGNSNIQAGSSDKKSKKSKSSKTMTKDGWVRKPSAFGSNPKRSNKHGVLGNFAADSGATATHSSPPVNSPQYTLLKPQTRAQERL